MFPTVNGCKDIAKAKPGLGTEARRAPVFASIFIGEIRTFPDAVIGASRARCHGVSLWADLFI